MNYYKKNTFLVICRIENFFAKGLLFLLDLVFITVFKLKCVGVQLVFLVCCSTIVNAQDVFKPIEPAKSLRAVRISDNIKVDGKLEEVWSKAKAFPLEFQVEPFQGKALQNFTEVKVMFNANFLYLSAYCKDVEGKKALRAPSFKRDFEFRSHDFFGVTIDGFNDKRNAMVFLTNPFGTQRDLLAFDDLSFDTDWDGLWRVRTARSDSGWVAEIALPWQTLRYPNVADSTQSWGFNFVRNRRKTNELAAWSPFPRTMNAVRMDYAGKITGLVPPPPKPNLRVNPYVLYSYQKLNGSEVGNAESTALKYGGELKWAVNPNLVLDFTYNTDFAQVDADRQVNNLTRFSVFFPERRQFFLENASLFSIGLSPLDEFWGGNMRVQPFFSRRIGLDDNGSPVAIEVGLRGVYRSADRNAGIIAMRQNNGLDKTNFFVGRYSENFGKQNRIGIIATVKNDESHSNYSTSIDGFFRLNNTNSINTMAMFSGSDNGQDKGFSGFYQYFHKDLKWMYWLVQSATSANFNPEIGFVSRRDVIETSPGFYWLYRGQKLPKYIRAFEPGSFITTYHSVSKGYLVERQINFNPVWFTFQNGGAFGVFADRFFQRIDETFNLLGNINLAKGEYNFNRYGIFTSTDGSKKVSFNSFIIFGDYYNGKLTSTTLKTVLAPSPHFSTSFSFQNDAFQNVGIQNVTNQVQLYSVESRIALNPRFQIVGFYQKNNVDDRDFYNFRLSWEYQPLSFVYLVFNNRTFDQFRTQANLGGKPILTTELARQQIQQTVAKISFLKQF